ncbi:MAG: acyl-CoA dehydrogenase, partial [Verrucomicrobiota bacterium]
LIYSRFRDAVKQNPITCLEHMLELYGLDCLRRDSGWMQRKGLLSAGQAGIITRRRAELIRLLRTDVGPLAEALTPESGGKLNANHLIDRSEIQQEKSPAEFCGRLV